MRDRQNWFLHCFARELASVEPHLHQVMLSSGQVLCETGERIRYVYFPHEGMVSKLTVFSDGLEVECALVGREGVIGAISALGMRNAVTRDVCHVPMRAARMDAETFHSVCRSSETLHAAVDRYCAWKMSCAIRNGACNACHTVEQRLARWILTCADILEDPAIPLSQDRLARMLAVQRSSVNPILQRFRTEGLLSVGRSRLMILKPDRLMQRACECYAVMKETEAHILRAGIYAACPSPRA
jgi:CRP-like cAMP-binding protein